MSTRGKPLTKKQAKFQNRVVAFAAMREMFGGWDEMAKHFKVPKEALIRMVLDDLDKTWGKKLKWLE